MTQMDYKKDAQEFHRMINRSFYSGLLVGCVAGALIGRLAVYLFSLL